MPPSRNRSIRFAIPVALLAALACGEGASAPQPFADVAGQYMLQTVNGGSLPYNIAGGTWLFERRLNISADGAFQQYDIQCNVNGDTCPRRNLAMSSTLERAGDGSLVFDFGSGDYVRATPDTSGHLVVLATQLGGYPGTRPTVTYRFQRQ